MGMRDSIPFPGMLLAAVTFVALLLLDVEFVLAIAVLIMWVGSLLVVTERAPDTSEVVVKQSLTPASIRKLIENSSTPVLVTEKNAIAIANDAARQMLGEHIVGQDARVTFRQPEAIALFSKNQSGKVIIRGLVRRQDIWQINRQSVEEDLAVVELINQTAEADISRAHTDFVANASHELRTPLASILGYVETLSESGEELDAPTASKFLGIIEREARRLQSLISDLMSLSRVEAEKHDLPQDMIDLRPITERAARDAAGSQRIERVELALTESAQVQGDQQQIEQVVRNLVDNALKYGSQDTPVKVTLDLTREGMARIEVTDQGEGIAPEQIPHLTRRFYRTDPGRSRASGGTGLGLAIVKHIVERHRGRLDIESQLGQGTSVTVRLPVKDANSDAEDVEKRAADKTGKAKKEVKQSQML